LQRTDATDTDKIEKIQGKILEFGELIVSYQREVDDAEGYLAQAAAEQVKAAAVKAEMEAIDAVQIELNKLWEAYFVADQAVFASIEREA
jgi:formate dehydrogenase maturation protein FdhE